MPTFEYNRYRNLLNSIGKAGAHALFPNDFEYYMCALELVDSRDRVIDYFVFPVTPSQMSYSEPQLTNIKKTAGGIAILKTSTFIPIDITISGSFGRMLRLLVGQQRLSFTALRFSVNTGAYSKQAAMSKNVTKRSPSFNPGLKTGYGATKILQAMCDKSVALDGQNKPMRLFFYNPALNANHLVEVTNLTLNQDKGNSNMLWQYNLTMKAVAPLDGLKKRPRGSLIKALAFDNLQKGVNKVVSAVKDNIR